MKNEIITSEWFGTIMYLTIMGTYCCLMYLVVNYLNKKK